MSALGHKRTFAVQNGMGKMHDACMVQYVDLKPK